MHPESSLDLPDSEPSPVASSTLPSSLPYKDWAASCPEYYEDFDVQGETVSARTKRCAFCGQPIRLSPRGDQALIEHMKSFACRAIQRELEREIASTAGAAASNMEPSTSTSSVPGAVYYGPPVPPPAAPVCQGAELVLSTNVWENYAWHLHGPNHTKNLSFYICSQNGTGEIVHIRSYACAGVAPPGRPCCSVCTGVLWSQELRSIMQRMETETPANGLNTHYYSYKQISDLLDSKDDQLKKYRLKGIELNRNARRLVGKLNDHKQLLVALSNGDDDAVARLVRTALRQGCGVLAIVDRIEKAQQGLYHCRSYTKKLYDIALVVLRLGGPRLLFILSRALKIPSLNVVYEHAEQAYLRPSIGVPILPEILHNIKSVCGRFPVSYTRGYTVMIDELAAQERLRFSYAEDAIVGVCREHAHVCDLTKMTGRPLSHFEDIKAHLDAGDCHRAKEATVVALAPFGQENYTPMVVLISGTCKTETVDDQKMLIDLVVHAWKQSEHGESAHGPIWSVATDGDPRRRQVAHRSYMSTKLPMYSPLYLKLCDLDLLNLYCGENTITHDGDYKHEEKRFASALRSGAGVFINGTHITPAIIKRHLRLVPDLAGDRLDALFDNLDRQNVPKAHTLLKGIYDASRLLETSNYASDRAFVLLGDVVHAFYAPFTTPSMALPQQVTSLAKCAFILFALFRTDGRRFISSQLYYDVQASIKNAMFCIAKTQLLDPSLPFYMLQLGDDRLEGLFGVYRSQSGSDCNPDVLGMAERAGAAQQVNNILLEYPGYDRKPYRLTFPAEGASGVDHLNPRSWVGDVCVGHVCLRTSWAEGRAQAEQALRRAGIIPEFRREILCALANSQDVDLMRPFGYYVGVTDSVPEEVDDTVPPTTVPDAANPAPPASEPHPTTVPSCASSDNDNDSSRSSTPDPDFTPVDPETFSHVPDTELPFESLLPPCMPAPEDDLVTVPEGPVKRGWIDVDGHVVHLESVTRLMLGTESTEKSADRLRRVRGFTRYPSANTQSDSLLGDLCLIGQPILGLVRVNHEIALAAVRVTTISTGDNRQQVESISVDHLSRSDVNMVGQILALDFSNGVWYWNESHVTVSGTKSGNDINTTGKPLVLKFKASAIELVNPTLVERNGSHVWSFEHHELVAAIALLWAKSSENRHYIPACSGTLNFPYSSDPKSGGHRLVHLDASRAVEAMPAERCGLCFLCGQTVPIKHYMRTHVAKHILAKKQNVPDPTLATAIGYAPCGFCGRSWTCKTTLATKRDVVSIISDCPYFDKFSYKSAQNVTATNPCTNRPIRCESPECSKKDPVWSYDMQDHIRAVHGEMRYNLARNNNLFAVSPQEIKFLRLDNPFRIPGKRVVALPPVSRVAGAKRPIEDSTAGEDFQAASEPQEHAEADTIASGSRSKQAWLGLEMSG
ncbi:hypothetical protein FRC08_008010 [Ceratobasidium sp. 394]|nr:hypothetical protein FRC08_008010 [Ceratobasidium sp. 394]